MILYILLVVFAGLMTIIALGLTIGGLVKNKQKLWICSLIGFVFFTLFTVYSSYIYVKKSIHYMSSDKFQTETKMKAENLGKTWGNTVSGAAQGLEATLDDEAIANLANKGGKIMGHGVKAFAKGIDESVGMTTVFIDESVDKVGISLGRANRIFDSTKYSFGLYLEFRNDFDGKLILTAFDSKGQKQDNSELPIVQKAGKEMIYVFQFDYFKPAPGGYCILRKE